MSSLVFSTLLAAEETTNSSGGFFGIIGVVTGIEDRYLWVEIAEGVQVQVMKGSVGSRVNMDGTPIVQPKPAKKSKKADKTAGESSSDKDKQ